MKFYRVSGVGMFEHKRRIGAAKAEGVRQNGAEFHIVATGAQNRHIGEFRIEFFDIGAFADKAVLHHQQRVNRFLNAGRAQRMAGERFRRGDGRAFIAGAEHFAQRFYASVLKREEPACGCFRRYCKP